MGAYEARLQKDLKRIRKRVRKMGRAVTASVQNSVSAVLDRDEELATDTILGDLPTNRLSEDLDHRCHVFVARHLPSAGHLRYISSVMRLNQTLERIGDYAETMSRAALTLAEAAPESTQRDIAMMGDQAVKTLERALGAFDEGNVEEAKATHSVISTFGSIFDKVYFDLVGARKTRGISDVAIIRMEQMYPFPHKSFGAELKKFSNATEVVWAQDEPQNQGPWFQIQHNIFENMDEGQRLAYAGRPASAAPAVGYSDKHVAQQKELLDTAFSKLKGFILTK